MKFAVSEENKRFWDLIFSAVTIVGVGVGGIFGIVQYMDARYKDRVGQTIAYLERYDQAPMSDDRLLFENSWEGVRDKLGDEIADNPGVDIKLAYPVIVLNALKDDAKLKAAIRQLILFHEQLAVCVNEDLCDAETAKKYFQSDAQELVHDAYPYICAERSSWKDRTYADKAVQFALGHEIDSVCPA